jgi:hypothetical protein
VARAPCCLVLREVAGDVVEEVEEEAKREEQEIRNFGEGDNGDGAEAGADDILAQPSHALSEKRRRFRYVGWVYVHDLQSVVGESLRGDSWERLDVE